MKWQDFILNESKKDYFKNIIKILSNEEFFPRKEDIFNAFKLTEYDDVNVVILGQDPYHEEGQAHGLAFSSLAQNTPKSLKNMFIEIKNDTGHIRKNANLTDWASQGVLLLNTTLTCKKHLANSHKDIGWQIFTDNVIKELNKRNDSIVYILLGNNAKAKISLIDKHHFIISASHPSPLSAYHGFFGCKCFSKCNEYLKSQEKKEIVWWDK